MSRVKVLRLTLNKMGHFGDVLPRQSLSTLLKKLNLTQQNQTHTSKPKDIIIEK